MKRLYIVSGDDVRREPATLEEIRRFLDGSAPRSWRDDQLSRITLGDDGAIVATPLTPDELQALRAEIDRLRREHLVRLCDLGLQSDRGESLTGISFSPATILVWASPATMLVWARRHRDRQRHEQRGAVLMSRAARKPMFAIPPTPVDARLAEAEAFGRALLARVAAMSPSERLAMRPAHSPAPRTTRDLERERPRVAAGVPNEPVPSRCAKCRSLDHATTECELSGLDLDESAPRRQMEMPL